MDSNFWPSTGGIKNRSYSAPKSDTSSPPLHIKIKNVSVVFSATSDIAL